MIIVVAVYHPKSGKIKPELRSAIKKVLDDMDLDCGVATTDGKYDMPIWTIATNAEKSERTEE